MSAKPGACPFAIARSVSAPAIVAALRSSGRIPVAIEIFDWRPSRIRGSRICVSPRRAPLWRCLREFRRLSRPTERGRSTCDQASRSTRRADSSSLARAPKSRWCRRDRGDLPGRSHADGSSRAAPDGEPRAVASAKKPADRARRGLRRGGRACPRSEIDEGLAATIDVDPRSRRVGPPARRRQGGGCATTP